MSARRITGIVLLTLGVLLALCSGGFVASYYSTSGFYDGPEWLADLGAGSVVAGGTGVLVGLAVAVVGVVLVARKT